MTDAALGHGLAWLGMLAFSAATVVSKPAVARMPLSLGFLVATGVNVLVAVLALVVQQLLDVAPTSWRLDALLLFFASGIFSTYLGRWFFYEAVARFGPGKASVFQVSSPLFTALIAWLWLGESLSWPVLLAMAVVISGLLLVSGPSAGPAPVLAVAADPTQLSWRERVLASMFLLGLGSSLAYSCGNVLRGTAIRSWNEPVLGALLGALAGVALHLMFMKERRQLWTRMVQADRRGLVLYCWMGVFTMAGQILAIAAMRYIPLSVAALVTLCTPLVVLPLSAWLFKRQEAITPRLVLGTVMTLGGMAVVLLR